MFGDRFAQLMARQLSGAATEEEIRELTQVLDSNPEARYFFEIFSEFWQPESISTDNDIQEEIHFQQIIAIAEKNAEPQLTTEDPVLEKRSSRIITFRKVLAIAACLLLIVFTGWLIAQKTNTVQEPAAVAMHEIEAKPAARTSLRLPDGTKVWLNSESRLEYKASFNDSIREVNLEGEAYFDVVKDKDHPFIVHTSDIDIRVLGTAFNVKSYPQESSIETTLIHGLIEVSNKKEPSSPKVILKPHQKLVFNKDGEDFIRPDNNPAAIQLHHKPYMITYLPKSIADSAVIETSWVYDKLVFDGESFREIARKMERWYNVKIRFRSEEVAKVPIHVEFKDESIEEALRALQLIEPFAYRLKDNEIEISKNEK